MKRLIGLLLSLTMLFAVFTATTEEVYAAENPYANTTWYACGYANGIDPLVIISISKAVKSGLLSSSFRSATLHFGNDDWEMIINGGESRSGTYEVKDEYLECGDLDDFYRPNSDYLVYVNYRSDFLGALVFKKSVPSADAESEEVFDSDTFKSEEPSGTVIVSDAVSSKSFFDMKVHSADAKSVANQTLLAKNLIGANANVILTQNIYPRRDLSNAENGSLIVLTWNNLPKNQAGPVSAVVYNQIDGAYVIKGILDANGKAVFYGFKLRPASTITICK